MKKKLTLLFFIFVYHVSSSQVWIQKAAVYTGPGGRGTTSFPIPSLGRGYAVGCAPGDYQTWEYDTLTDSWIQRNNFIGGADGTQVGFSINGIAYLGSGVATGCQTYNTFFKYDPVADAWTQLPNVPGPARGYATGFTVGGIGYIGGGITACTSTSYNDFYGYNPTTNTWDTIMPCPAKGCGQLAVGFAINGKGYVGTGDSVGGGRGYPQQDFWEYDPSNNTWTRKADFPGGVRGGATGFATCDKGYIGLGYSDLNQTICHRDFYQFDPVKNTWTQIANFGGVSRQVAPSFVIGKSCYVALGVDSANNTKNDIWEYIQTSTPAFTTVGGSTTVCTGQSVSFTDTSNFLPDNWQWSFPGGTPDTSTKQNPVISYDTTGTWDVTLTAWNGCDSATKTFSKYITVNPGGTLTIVPASASVCSGTPVTLTVSGGNKITWNPGATLNKTTGDTVVANPSLTTTYTASDSSGSCISTQQVVVTIVPSDTAGTLTAARDTICEGTTTILNLAGNNSNIIQWQSSTTQGNFDDTLAMDTVKYTTLPLSQSTYFRVKVGNGACTAFSDTVYLFIPPVLTASFNFTVSGNMVTFNSDSSIGNIVTYSWAFGDGGSSNQKNPSHPYAKTDTTYNACLTIYDGSNCSYTFCKDVPLFTGIASVPGMGTFQLYPNPVCEQLAVSSLQLAGCEINITDILGRTLLVTKASGDLTTIDVSNLSSGVYVIQVRSEAGTVVKKFVKE